MASDKTTLYLSKELHRALEEYLGKKPRQAIGSIGAGEDADLSASRSEEWLRDEWSK